MDLVVIHMDFAQKHVESSRTRDQTHVPWIGRKILNYCPTREVPNSSFYSSDLGLYVFVHRVLPQVEARMFSSRSSLDWQQEGQTRVIPMTSSQGYTTNPAYERNVRTRII